MRSILIDFLTNLKLNFESKKQRERITCIVTDQECPDKNETNSLNWFLVTICLCWFRNQDLKKTPLLESIICSNIMTEHCLAIMGLNLMLAT